MNVLWFVNVELPSIAMEFGRVVNTGGWLNVMSEQLSKQFGIELHIAYPGKQDCCAKFEHRGIYYYSFSKSFYECIQNIIIDVQPDLVHIWGTEFEHSYIATCILERLHMIGRTIISIQGLVSIIGEYHYATCLPVKVIYGRTLAEFLFRRVYTNISDAQREMIRQGDLEQITLQKNVFCIGRTDFDYACIRQINPHMTYFHCYETLREGFYKRRWRLERCEKHTIFFGQSYYPVKGVHIFIEALAIIKEKYPDIKVKIVGKDIFEKISVKDRLVNRSYPRYLRELINRHELRTCIQWLGQQTEEEMIEQFCSSNVFVSSSLIENSSNSIGEAMLLGMPIVASDVGGVKSLMEHNKEGILYQETAPYMLADGVIRIFENDEWACQLGENAHQRASIIHDRDNNLKKLLEIYKTVAKRG